VNLGREVVKGSGDCFISPRAPSNWPEVLVRMRSRLIPVAVAAASLFAFIPTVDAGTDVKLLVLKEHGVGSAAQAQPFLDKLMGVAQKAMGWSSASGKYTTDRGEAEEYISKENPQYGILSLPAYLAMKDSKKLEVIGQVTVANGGGLQYFIVSKSASSLADCKGAKLATDHDDKKFIDKVASGGAFKMDDFDVQTMKRPLQGIKAVIKDEAKCALIDDAQLSALATVDGGKDVKKVWSSAAMPPMPVVAFPSADSADKKKFSGILGNLCTGDAKTACNEVGIQTLKSASDSDYGQVLASYQK
jgi:hypothetical protein